MQAYSNYFDKLVEGASDDVAAHRRFYDEYLSVLDLTAEFFLQTVDLIFHQRAMAERKFVHRGQLVDCSSIRTPFCSRSKVSAMIYVVLVKPRLHTISVPR